MVLKDKKQIFDFFIVMVGTFLTAISVVVFFDANELVLGGVSGISIVIKELGKMFFGMELPLSIISFAINLPLLIGAYIIMGKGFLGKTVFSTVLFSIFLEITKFLPVYKGELMLAAIYGGAVLGVGAGFIFKGRATSGGSDLLAAMIYKFNNHISLSKILFIIDAIVIGIGLFVFGVEKSMYSVISVFICTKVAGGIIDGIGFAKAVFIISDKSDEIAKDLMENQKRGVTALKGKGMYTGNEKDVLLCVFSQKEISDVKERVMEIDSNAFMMVTDIKEVLGEGFVSYKL